MSPPRATQMAEKNDAAVREPKNRGDSFFCNSSISTCSTGPPRKGRGRLWQHLGRIRNALPLSGGFYDPNLKGRTGSADDYRRTHGLRYRSTLWPPRTFGARGKCRFWRTRLALEAGDGERKKLGEISETLWGQWGPDDRPGEISVAPPISAGKKKAFSRCHGGAARGAC